MSELFDETPANELLQNSRNIERGIYDNLRVNPKLEFSPNLRTIRGEFDLLSRAINKINTSELTVGDRYAYDKSAAAHILNCAEVLDINSLPKDMQLPVVEAVKESIIEHYMRGGSTPGLTPDKFNYTCSGIQHTLLDFKERDVINSTEVYKKDISRIFKNLDYPLDVLNGKSVIEEAQKAFADKFENQRNTELDMLPVMRKHYEDSIGKYLKQGMDREEALDKLRTEDYNFIKEICLKTNYPTHSDFDKAREFFIDGIFKRMEYATTDVFDKDTGAPVLDNKANIRIFGNSKNFYTFIDILRNRFNDELKRNTTERKYTPQEAISVINQHFGLQ